MKKNSGFTLIEILIVIAVGVILSTAGFLSYSAMSERKDVELSLQELGSTVKEVQRRSVNQQDGARWSMRFTANSEGADKYEIYSGATYATSSVEQSYSFNRPVRFSEPGGDRSIDLNFEPVTGQIDNKKVITITHNKQSARAGDIILNTLGLVTERMEDGIVGYWHFDEGSGATSTDASGEGNDGEIIGASWESENNCIAGRCLEFDGNNDYIAVPDSNILDSVFGSSNKTFTLSAWVYPNSWTSYSTVFNKAFSGSWSNTTVGLWSYSGGLRCNIGSNVSGNPPGSYVGIISKPSLNNWHHVVCVGDGDNLSMYINGESVGSTSIPETVDPTSNNDPLTIGRRHDGQNESFPGLMDELKVYNRALSADEIQRMYNDLRP